MHEKEHANGQGQEGMRYQKDVKQSFRGCRVANIVRKPGEDPGEAEKGLHVAVEQVRVHVGIRHGNEGHEGQAQGRLQFLEIGPHAIAKVRLRYLQEDGGG